MGKLIGNLKEYFDSKSKEELDEEFDDYDLFEQLFNEVLYDEMM